MTPETPFRPHTFAVVGAGPVGCVVAAFLAKSGHEVVICDVSRDLLEPIQTRGIRIEGAVELRAVITETCASVDELAGYRPEVIFLTVKAHALPLIASALEGFLTPGTAVVSWQNGIDTELVLAETLGRKPVLRAVVNYGCSLLGPGHVQMPFHHPPHFLQELEPGSRPAALGVCEALSRCGLETRHTDRIVSMVWRKAILNACMNPVCAATGLTMAQAMGDPMVFQIVDALLKECVQVARANEIQLGWDFYSYAIGYMKKAGDHKPSMLVDIERARRTEIDFINGKFIGYGDQAGIATPYNRTLRALVKTLESKER